MPPSKRSTTREVPVRAFRFGEAVPSDARAAIPVEMPVEIVFGEVPFAVMMLTPDDVEDFAVGFCLTEGIVASPSDIREIGVTEEAPGLRLAITLAPDRMAQHLARRRAISGRTGCGVCGVEDLAALERRLPPLRRGLPVAVAAIGRALAALEERQTLNAVTHAVHAAAFADEEGRILHLREDVGRHNALDKLIGAALRTGRDPASGFVVITSRCSFEMVDKTAAFGAGLLVAISAPTTLALDRARHLGMRLVGIARRDGVTVFLEGPPAAAPGRSA